VYSRENFDIKAVQSSGWVEGSWISPRPTGDLDAGIKLVVQIPAIVSDCEELHDKRYQAEVARCATENDLDLLVGWPTAGSVMFCPECPLPGHHDRIE
jgi:hypothetical protein